MLCSRRGEIYKYTRGRKGQYTCFKKGFAMNLQSTMLPYRTARYSPSTATLACQTPSLLTARKAAGAGNTKISAGNTKMMRVRENTSVMLGLMTRK